jgi:hypothetical protein
MKQTNSTTVADKFDSSHSNDGFKPAGGDLSLKTKARRGQLPSAFTKQLQLVSLLKNGTQTNSIDT